MLLDVRRWISIALPLALLGACSDDDSNTSDEGSVSSGGGDDGSGGASAGSGGISSGSGSTGPGGAATGGIDAAEEVSCAELSACCPLFDDELDRLRCEGVAQLKQGCGALLFLYDDVCSTGGTGGVAGTGGGTGGDGTGGVTHDTLPTTTHSIPFELAGRPLEHELFGCDGDNAISIWQNREPGEAAFRGKVFASRYDGNDWSTSEEISTNTGAKRRAFQFAASDNCHAIVTWLEWDDELFEGEKTMAAVYDPSSGWTAATVVDAHEIGPNWPRPGIDDAGNAAIHVGGGETAGSGVTKRYDYTKADGFASKVIHSEALTTGGDLAMLSDGSALMAYAYDAGNDVSLIGYEESSSLGSWGSRKTLAGSGDTARFDLFAMVPASDRFYYIYFDHWTLASELISQLPGQVPVRYELPPNTGGFTVFAHGSTAFVVESDYDTPRGVLVMRVTPAGGVESKLRVTDPEIHVRTYDAAVNDRGDFLLVFYADEGLFAVTHSSADGWSDSHYIKADLRNPQVAALPSGDFMIRALDVHGDPYTAPNEWVTYSYSPQ